MNAAKALSAISPRYKTAFVTLAIEAFQRERPNGVDMQELSAVQLLTWGTEVKIETHDNVILRTPTQADLPIQVGEESQEDIQQALNYYNI